MRVLVRPPVEFPTAPEMAGTPLPRLFATDSPWNTPVANYTPYQHPTIPAANSRNWIRSLCAQMNIDPDTGQLLAGQPITSGWSETGNVPVYVVPAGYPRHEVRLTDTTIVPRSDELDAMLRRGVPIPSDAMLMFEDTPDADHWLNIVQPSTDSLWEAFRAERTVPGGRIDRFGWGGVILGVRRHRGTYYRQEAPDGTFVGGDSWSPTATSISNLCGLVQVEDYEKALRDGTDLGHALPCSLGHAQATPIGFVYPATRGDGVEENRPDYIPEGARVVFPPGADFSRVQPVFMPIARTIQKYGMIGRDKTGYGVALHSRWYGLSNRGDPWTQYFTPWRPHLYDLPWHQAIVVAN